jgi:hypothetical protein
MTMMKLRRNTDGGKARMGTKEKMKRPMYRKIQYEYVMLDSMGIRDSIARMKNKDEVVIHRERVLMNFTYPLKESCIVELVSPTGSFTRAELALAISKVYREIAREGGLCGHGLSDLAMHCVYVNGMYCSLGIDS